MSDTSALTADDWDTLRALVQAVQSGRPIYYAINDAPERVGKVSIMQETVTNPWVLVCDTASISQWKVRIPHIQRAELTNGGKTVLWGVTG